MINYALEILFAAGLLAGSFLLYRQLVNSRRFTRFLESLFQRGDK